MIFHKGVRWLFAVLCPSFLLFSCQRKQAPAHVLSGHRVIMVLPDTAGHRYSPPRDTSYLEHVFAGYDLVNIATMDSTIEVDLRYADTANFVRTNLYDGLRYAYMTCDLAIKLCNAQYHLRRHDSTLTLVVLDAARPLHLQQIMWDSLNLLPEVKRKYLTPPEVTSLHNYGCAVDVTLRRRGEKASLDMGSRFDQFDSLSQPRFEKRFAADSILSRQVLENRSLLRHVMAYAGLRDITTEWWHFSLCRKEEAARKYPLIR